MEQPIYVLKPDKKAYFAPRIAGVVILGILVYLGVFLNLRFLDIEISIYYILGAVILALLLTGFAFLETYLKYSSSDYYFYSDRMYANGMWIPYTTIFNIDIKIGIFDSLFKTSTIVLGKSKLRFVPDSKEIQNYIIKIAGASKHKL